MSIECSGTASTNPTFPAATPDERARQLNEFNRQKNESIRHLNDISRQNIERNQQNADRVNNAISNAFDSIMDSLQQRRDARAAAQAEADYENQMRQQAAMRQYEETVRRETIESFQRQGEREAAFLRQASERGSPGKENEDLVQAIEDRMKSSASPEDARRVFASDGAETFLELERPAMPILNTPDILPVRDEPYYQQISPPQESMYGSVFEAVRDYVPLPSKETVFDYAVTETIEHIMEDEPASGNWLTNKVSKIVIDQLWEAGLDRLHSAYARYKTDGSASEVDLKAEEIYAAAHPAVGLATQILRSKGNIPVALYTYGTNLVNKMGTLLGFATENPESE